MGLDCTGSNMAERLGRKMRSKNTREGGFKSFDAGEKRRDSRMVKDLRNFLFLLILGTEKLIM